MCRSIKQLRYPERPPTDEELEAAALQFIRKVTGYRTPSRANEEAFQLAIDEIAAATRTLFDGLVIRGQAGLEAKMSKPARSPLT